MPGLGLGLGLSLPRSSVDAGTTLPAQGDLIFHIHPQAVTKSGNYISQYTIVAGSYGGTLDAVNADPRRQEADGTTANSLALAHIDGDPGGNEYEFSAPITVNDWTVAWTYYTPTVDGTQGDWIWLTDTTQARDQIGVPGADRVWAKHDAGHKDITAVNSLPKNDSTLHIVIVTRLDGVGNTYAAYLDGADITVTPFSNLTGDMIFQYLDVENWGPDSIYVADRVLYGAKLSLADINLLGTWISDKYALGQTWSLS